MQTGILVLLVILVGILCIALFFTNKEVRNIKTGVVKSRHDIAALQILLNDVGLTASGGRPELKDAENIIDGSGHPTSQFAGHKMPPNISMFPPGAFPPGVNPRVDSGEESEHSNQEQDKKSPSPVPANTEADPATLNLEKPDDVIPVEDVEEVKEQTPSVKSEAKQETPTKSPVKAPAKAPVKPSEEEGSSEEESDSDEESSEEDDE